MKRLRVKILGAVILDVLIGKEDDGPESPVSELTCVTDMYPYEILTDEVKRAERRRLRQAGFQLGRYR